MKKKIFVVGIILITLSMFIGSKYIKYHKYDDNLYLAVLVDGTEQNNFPEKGDYEVKVTCNNVGIKWDYDNWKLIAEEISNNTKCSIAFNTSNKVNLANYIISLASDSTNTGVYNENGYRYEGKSPNNYIMFNGEYWRIIGVFDDTTHGKTGQQLVKIIRADKLAALVWDKSKTNNWNTSSLKTLLNNNYYNGTEEATLTNCYGYSATTPSNCDFTRTGIIKEYYRDMIEEVTWSLGGVSSTSTTAETFFTSERGTTVYSGNPTEGTGKIGLMYPSDYGYSVLASSCARTTNLSSYNNANCGGQSWLYDGYEWTLTPISTCRDDVSHINTNGRVSSNAVYGYGVRPSLYLKSDTMKLSGEGSKSNPYIIVR